VIGKFIGVGVGPGDPELITLKAAKILKAADIICVPKSHADKPSMALGMVKQVLAERQIPPQILELVFPMSKDELSVRTLWTKNAAIVASKAFEGKTLVFITLGDPMFYSTFLYLYQHIKEGYPQIPLEIVPGVTSITACAASAKLPLAEKEEVVAIIPSDLDSERIAETAKHVSNLVFMKCAHRLKDLVPILEKSGFTSDSAVAIVKRCTLPEEKILVGRLSDVQGWNIHEDYFSVAIIKKTPLPVNQKQVNKA
jgi:precorrin-2/cobalt-factor-2 C20-methyltransferase